jgi:biotin carboxylase
MSQRTILIVGNSFSNLRSYLREHNFEYITLKDAAVAKHPEKRLKRRVLCDFSTPESILQTVDKLAKTTKIDGVMCIYEHYILAAAQIAEHLGLPGMPIEAAKACTDKYIMRGKFKDAPAKISPDYTSVTSEADVRRFAEAHEFPIILKPANLSKSLLVTKNHTMDELLQNYQRTMGSIDAVYAKYAPGAVPKLLIEEFMEGPVHSVDAFIDERGQPHVLDAVVDYQTGYEIGYDDNFHYSRLLPSKLTHAQTEDIRRVAAMGCKALGMRSSPAHVEIIRTKDGPRIVEIGARNGGYRERMHWLANDYDITGSALRLALGEAPDIELSRREPVAVLELFPKTPGTFTGIANEDKLEDLPSLVYFDVKAEPGKFVGKSSDGYKMCAVVILHHADSEQFTRDLDFVNNSAHVTTSA